MQPRSPLPPDVPPSSELTGSPATQTTAIRKNLQRLGLTATTEQLNTMLLRFPDYYRFLLDPNIEAHEGKKVFAAATSSLNTSTKARIVKRFGYVIDGPMRVSAGQTKSLFYYAIKESTGSVIVAKVYPITEKDSYDLEVQNAALTDDIENIVSVETSFSFEQSHYIILPFYPRSAADILIARAMTDYLVVVIAHSVLKAIEALHLKGYCFSDIKPSNIMLGQGGPDLVDLASIVPLGQPTFEITKQYCLDCDTNFGSKMLDYYCLGSTISHLLGMELNSREVLLDWHSQMTDKEACTIAIKCLTFSS